MARPAKKVDIDSIGWITEYLVSRVNREDWKLQLSRFSGKNKRNPGNVKPKSQVYQMAAIAVDLQDFPDFGQDQIWLDSLQQLIADANQWIDDHLSVKDRTRMWTAFRVAKQRGIDPSDTTVYDNYVALTAENQERLEKDNEKEKSSHQLQIEAEGGRKSWMNGMDDRAAAALLREKLTKKQVLEKINDGTLTKIPNVGNSTAENIKKALSE